VKPGVVVVVVVVVVIAVVVVRYSLGRTITFPVPSVGVWSVAGEWRD